MTKNEALKLALETAEGIVKSDWRKWQELASPDEFERWVKSRALHMATAIKETLAQPDYRAMYLKVRDELAELQQRSEK